MVDNYSNGKIDGVCYFTPQAGRGKFMRMTELQPDQRFAEISAPNNGTYIQYIRVSTSSIGRNAFITAQYTFIYACKIISKQIICYMEIHFHFSIADSI